MVLVMLLHLTIIELTEAHIFVDINPWKCISFFDWLLNDNKCVE